MEEGRTHGKYKMNIAVLNLETETVGDIRIFEGADNMNPSFDMDGNIVFLSDRDGFRNMYKYEMASGQIYQMTKLNTGISGITKYSPAISVSRKKDRIVYTHYYRGDYSIHQSSAEKLLKIPVGRDDIDFTAATLPSSGTPQLVVQTNLENIDQLPDTTDTEERPYRPRFTLDHFGGGAGVGIGTGNIGSQAALAGGVQMFFSDITGNHQLFTTVAMNGSLRDIGGQITYLNRKGRIAYGLSVSHLPQRFFTGSLYSRDTIGVNGSPTIVDRIDNYVLTIFEENASLIGELPLSKTTRLEANAGVTYRFYRMDAFPEFYYPGGGYLGEGDRERIPLEGDEFNLGYYVVRKGAFYNFTGAFVGDNAQFGVTAPMNGYRYRFEVTKFVGTYDFLSTNADVRGYKWLGPIALAGRFQFGARHGKDANTFNPIFVGWQGFVRGYTYNQIEKLVANDPAIVDDINFRSDVTVMYRRLSGSKYFNAGLEVRLPFTGPEKLSLFKSSVLLTDLNFFFDAGAAFDEWSHFSDGERIIVNRPGGISEEFHKPKVAMSTGLSMRINLFGAMVVEPYFAYPLQKNSRMVFGFNFLPGW
jgi:hypothetical protein